MNKISFIGFLLGIFLSIPSIFAQTVRYEAEDFVFSAGTGAPTIGTDATLSGGKYVATNEGTITKSFTVIEEGFFDFFIFASAPNGDKVNDFILDNNSVAVSMTNSATYKRIKVASFAKLTVGTHSIAIKKSWGWINVDYIEMVKVDPSSRFNIVDKPVTTNPTAELTALYDFLKDNYGQKIISGVMTLESMDMIKTVKGLTGKEPALIGIDFMQCNQGYTWYNDDQPRLDAENYYNRNGIPALTWHWRDPLRVTDQFYTYNTTDKTNGTKFDVTCVFDPTSAGYKAMISDIDYIADQMLYLQSKKIAVIWRPLHEAAGGWFWWGAKGGAACNELWRVMYERMVNVKGVRNCLWVWTYEPMEDGTWYPGDEYVDIIGRDIYDKGNHTSKIVEFNNISSMHNGTKIVAESECGSFPDPDLLQADGAAWSFFMPWYETPNGADKFITDPAYNTKELWVKTMNHDYVITLDEMPNLRSYTSTPNDDAGLKSIVLNNGILKPIFTSATKSYTVLLPVGTAVPTIVATPNSANAKITVTNPATIPGTATIKVVSADGKVTESYSIDYGTYIQIATKLSITPETKAVVAGEIVSFTASILDQNDAAINAEVTWSATTGTIVPTGNAALYTAPTTTGTFNIKAEYGSLISEAVISVIDGYHAPTPAAGKWIAINEWENQNQGLGLTNAKSALSVNHIEWGYGEVWVVNSGDEIAIEDGVEYDIMFDYEGSASASAVSIAAGFADTWTTKGVTAHNSDIGTVASGLSNTGFTTQVVTVTASYTGKTNLFFQLLWGADPTSNKPSVATSSLIKNVKILSKKSNPVQSITLTKGWNFVSTYIESADMAVSSVFECAGVIKNDSDFYNSAQPSFLNGMDKIETGKGYLIWTEQGCSVLLEGTINYASTVKLSKGWNIVGYPFNTSQEIDSVLSSIDGQIISVKDFDNFWIKDGLNTFTKLSPGKAYYVNVSEDCTITW